jgi:hypothetical protein
LVALSGAAAYGISDLVPGKAGKATKVAGIAVGLYGILGLLAQKDSGEGIPSGPVSVLKSGGDVAASFVSPTKGATVNRGLFRGTFPVSAQITNKSDAPMDLLVTVSVQEFPAAPSSPATSEMFSRVSLKAGESKVVTVDQPIRAVAIGQEDAVASLLVNGSQYDNVQFIID